MGGGGERPEEIPRALQEMAYLLLTGWPWMAKEDIVEKCLGAPHCKAFGENRGPLRLL